MKRTSMLGLALIACATATLAAAPVPPKLVVLDVEITGDLGGAELAAEHQARLSLASTKLRRAWRTPASISWSTALLHRARSTS